MLPDNLKSGYSHLSNWQLLHANWMYSVISSKKFETIIIPFFQFIIRFRLPLQFLIKPIYKHFYCGKDLEHSIQIIRNMAKKHIFTTVHYGGEVATEEVGFNKNYNQIMHSIEFAHTHLKIKIISCKVTSMTRAFLLEKIQNKTPLTHTEQQEYELLLQRITAICDQATMYQIGIYWDAEVSWIQNVIDNLILKQMEIHNKEEAYIFNTCQMYRKDGLNYLENALKYATEKKFILGIKLVRGSYLIDETKKAKSNGGNSAIFDTKIKTDEAYNKAIDFCLKNIEQISVCIGTHNKLSNEHAIQVIDELQLPKKHPHIWFSQLYGMGEPMSTLLAEMDYNVTKYTPYGKIKDTLHYLLRRAHENTATPEKINREGSLLKNEIFRRSIESNKQLPHA